MSDHQNQIVKQEQSAVSRLYGGQENVNDLAAVVKKVAPWAKGFSNDDIGLAVRRAVSMGLDPLNSHEVQIWKDKRGNVKFQISYTLLAEWVSYHKGDFTDPQYRRLTEDELFDEGLVPTDIAYRCSFLMKKDIPLLGELVSGGYPPDQARRMLEVSGIGVASKGEYNGKYFAPAGRSKSWKVQKRAFVDAVRRKWGTPSRPEIEELRRERGNGTLTIGDWEHGGGTERGAQIAAGDRKALEEREQMTPEERLAEYERNRSLLRGDPDDEFIEGSFEDPTPESTPTPEPDPTPEPEDAGGDEGDLDLHAYDPSDLPDPCPWEYFHKAAVEHLGYNHKNHVLSAWRKIVGNPAAPVEDKHGNVPAPIEMWLQLRDHQEAKAA
jgi:hypothetical protein